MNQIDVKKDALLDRLRVNREKHAADFVAAKAGYIETLQEKLDEMGAKLAAGEMISSFIKLDMPESHLKDYDRAIQMLEWHKGSEIKMDAEEFAQYVQDDWHWKDRWQTSNAAYMSKSLK